MTVHVDRYTKVVLTMITILLVMLVVGVWSNMPTMMPEAQAGLPDQGAQLNEVIAGLKTIEGKIDGLSALLVSGKVKVQTTEAKPTKK